jgi:signal transduction histidine kinase
MHPLLRRQLSKIGVDESGPTPEQWRALLERVSATYSQADQDRYMLERSLEHSSEEMQSLYEDLRKTTEAEIERKSDELASSLALMKSVQESVREGILVVDTARTVVSFNQNCVAMSRSAPKIVGGVPDAMMKNLETLVEDQAQFAARIIEIYGEPEMIATDEIVLRDGRIVSRYSAPVRAKDGAVTGRVWSFRDVTVERKLAARRAVVAERMASVGQLVASVAHEINNPLAYIAGNVELAMDALAQGDTRRMRATVEALADAKAGVERINVIVRDLRALSRVDDETREVTDLHAVLETALQMANNELRHRAQVIRELDVVPLVSANPVRLTQVFLNLLLNAAHAIPDGRASANIVTVRTSTTASGAARIEVIDTGSGMDADTLERIFDPFFTTKPMGVGTGLGLSICRGIVDKLGGSIDVESRLGAGSTFVVELPASAPTSTRNGRAPSDNPAPVTERRAILVVDDDPQIRRWVERALHDDEVTSVASVDAAALAIETRKFDAILCDVMMPDRTGLDMHGILQHRHPELLPRIVFMSGGAFTPTLAAFIEKVPNICLKKPFTRTELERAVETASSAR